MITSVDGDSWVADYLADAAFKALFNAAWAFVSSDSLHRGRVWAGDLIRVPVGRVLEITRDFHDGATSGHGGTAKTASLFARRFQFSKMRQQVHASV